MLFYFIWSHKSCIVRSVYLYLMWDWIARMLNINSFVFRDMSKPKGKHESKMNGKMSLLGFFYVLWNLFWESNLKVAVNTYNIGLNRFVGRFVNTAHLIQNVKNFTLLLGYIQINTHICTFLKVQRPKKNKKKHVNKTIALRSEVSFLISKHTWLSLSFRIFFFFTLYFSLNTKFWFQ